MSSDRSRSRHDQAASAMKGATERTDPQITNQVLVSFERSDVEQVRVTLDTAPIEDGGTRRWVSFRKWVRGRDGEWRPTRLGTTIRRHELGEALLALQEAERIWGQA